MTGGRRQASCCKIWCAVSGIAGCQFTNGYPMQQQQEKNVHHFDPVHDPPAFRSNPAAAFRRWHRPGMQVLAGVSSAIGRRPGSAGFLLKPGKNSRSPGALFFKM